MKTITKTFNVYNYDELNKDAQKEAAEAIGNKIIDDNFYFLEDELDYLLKEKYNLSGFKISYSLCYCQGDGVCFYNQKQGLLSYTNITKNSDLNIFEKHILSIKEKNIEQYNLIIEYLNSGYNLFIIKNSLHYSHCYTCIIDYELYINDDEKLENKVNEAIEQLKKELFDIYIGICGELEKTGYKCYNVTDDDIKAYCNDNEIEFYEDGAIYG